MYFSSPQGHIRISDLGLAVRLTTETEVRGRVGTLGYMGMYTPHNSRQIARQVGSLTFQF